MDIGDYMISLPRTEFWMPTIINSDGQSINPTLETLPYWDKSIEASKTVRELLELLDKNVEIPGVLVLDGGNLVGLIAREKVYEKLGRPFGVELFLKNANKQFYESLGVRSLVLEFDTLIDTAVNMALARDKKTLYDPIIIEHPNGYRVISMYSLLIAQQETLHSLYSEVRHLSTKDPLTLTNNRRGFFDIVNEKLAQIRVHDLEHAVFMIDLDNFKSVNDRYGHLVGDEVIKSVAQRISEQIREGDVLGRFGGEEFVVFLMDVSKDLAFNLAENLRQDIASFFHTINWFQIRVTISIGVSHSKGASRTFDRLLTEADQAVYVSKSKGRNKVTLWDENMSRLTVGHRIFRKTINGTANQSDQVSTQVLQGLLHMQYLRDYETEAHTVRVSEMALKLAKKAGVPEEEYESIRVGSLLHDIGKIGIPDKILLKQDKLTESEWAIMKKHPQYAYDLLSPISYFQQVLEIPYSHHEHWDGKGYPRGLREEEIPLAARIFTVVDIWDALSSDRPYRAAWKISAVRDYLTENAGLVFDPALVPLFIECLNENSPG